MINRRKKQFINGILILLFIVGLFITGDVLYSTYIGKKKEKELIMEYEKSLVIGEIQSNKEENSKVSNSNKNSMNEKNNESKYGEHDKSKEKKNVLGLLEINDINLKAPIVNGVSDENMKHAVVHFENSSLPGEAGNCVLAAHNNIYGSIFENLDELKKGDIISINYNKNTYRYKVYDKQVVEPSDLSVIEEGKENEITLITCSDSAKSRLIVKGILVS
ncbi:class D sortase [Clostridium sp. B9]|uniref:class D sortase n=1 Tax=Clostridium sp. B9 TaxID=3423224 RepID=UPI003D2EE45B